MSHIGTNYRFLYRIEAEVNKYGKQDINLQEMYPSRNFFGLLLKAQNSSYEIEDDVIIIHPSKDDNKKRLNHTK